MHRIVDRVTNVVMNYSEVETKVREATNDDTWGPHGTLMTEIAKYTFTYEHYPEVMSMVWKRMFETKKNWRRMYKSLLLLHYLIRNGSERVVTNAREHVYDMKPLEEYTCRDDHGRDQGVNVRQKTKDIIGFLQDDERLRDARKAAKQTRDKYVGYSSDQANSKYSDRYDSEPRSKSHFDSHARYDEDPRFSSHPYTDNDNEDSFRDKHNTSKDSNKEKEEEGESGSSVLSEEQQQQQQQPPSQPSPVATKKSSQPSKLVDLGAASAYASQQQKQPPAAQQVTSSTGNGVLDQVFGSTLQTQPQPTAVQGFDADFDAAFSSRTEEQQSTGTGPVSPGFGEFSSFQPAPNPNTFGSFQQPILPVTSQVQPQHQQPTFNANFGAFQNTSSAPQQQNPLGRGGGFDLLQPQPTGGSPLQPQSAFSSQQPQQQQTEAKKQSPKSTLWSSSGLDIDMDNLLSSPKSKAAVTTVPPSMNQLASGGAVSSLPAMGGGPGPTGPNYNVNTSMLATSSRGTSPGVGLGMGMPPGGMGMQPGTGQMGMAQAGPGMGMNYGGMGYGGVGMRPGFGAGFGGQPMMGGGYGPMGMQQQQRPF